MKALTPVLLCWCAAVCVAQDIPSRLVCYYTSWARYRSSIAKFTPENINPHLCTHLHYAVVNANDKQELGPADKFSDIDQQGYEHMVALKAANPALKVLMMLGGSGQVKQEVFLELASDEAKIERFVRETIKYIRRHRFDGIDIDWKVEGKKEEHARLMEALAAGFMEEAEESRMNRLLLTTTIPANITKIRNGFDRDQWVAYDDEVMMRRKGVYIREQGLGGAAVWALAQDDFRGVCTGRPYPLIEALKEGLFANDMAPPTTPSPPPTPVYDNTSMMFDKEVTDAEELRQLLALVQKLGGVRSVQRLLAAMDGPKRGAVQPAAQTTVTEVGGDLRVKVHVIVE
ncbi:endochitinase-like, partial [Pollicipes pollicipes]|uniref:endochitinase-like n=1 Tax=Pollicipes pollicipes TaxID=41117 RepID=UPI001884A9CA